jgi:hypothetical protein
MLAALIWGCGRSSSNDRPSGGEQLSDDQAIEQIATDSVTFDECTLDEYAHAISRNEDIDDVQLAYMVMHCKAAAEHLDSIITGLQKNNDAADTYNVLTELAQARWLSDYKYIVHFLKSMSLPSQLQQTFNDIVSINDRINQSVGKIEQQQRLQSSLLYAI